LAALAINLGHFTFLIGWIDKVNMDPMIPAWMLEETKPEAQADGVVMVKAPSIRNRIPPVPPAPSPAPAKPV
jgi:hypothetical protein